MFTRIIGRLGRIQNFNHSRSLMGERKKFYKKASLSIDNGKFEINLDNRKLKTPKGNVFKVENEPLALMIAQEWNGQQGSIKLHEMHLTSLMNTSLDDPLHLDHSMMVSKILEHLYSDTICFRIKEPQDLYNLQTEKWDTLLEWFRRTFHATLPTSHGVFLDEIPLDTTEKVSRYLSSFNKNSLIGFQFILDNLKSIVITLALVHKYITVNEAVYLSRLEQEYQITKWGSVEWAHDTDLMLMRSRVAAGLIFFTLNSETEFQSSSKIATKL